MQLSRLQNEVRPSTSQEVSNLGLCTIPQLQIGGLNRDRIAIVSNFGNFCNQFSGALRHLHVETRTELVTSKRMAKAPHASKVIFDVDAKLLDVWTLKGHVPARIETRGAPVVVARARRHAQQHAALPARAFGMARGAAPARGAV